MTSTDGAPLLQVDGLTVSAGSRTLVDDVSFDLERDSRTGLIGESGSGKSLTALAIMGLLPHGLSARGSVKLYGQELLGLDERSVVRFRGNDIAMIFQEPMTALNPLHRVGDQVAESLMIHREIARSAANERAVELLAEVGIDDAARRARAYPHQLSGGQRQRVMIAAALACSPDLVIADEPTTALDVTVQQQVLAVLSDEAQRNDAALLLITHDLPVVSNVADQVLVMRSGAIVERGPTATVFGNPADGYTSALVAAVPPMARGHESRGAPEQHPDFGERLERRRERQHDTDDARTDDARTDAARDDHADSGDDTGNRVGSAAASDRVGRPAPDDGSDASDRFIEVVGVSKRYRLPRTRLFGDRPELLALDNVSLTVRRGETFGVVGESGSGKSTLARCMIGLTQPSAGRINVAGIAADDSAAASALHSTVQMVFQDPNGSLDPRMRIGDIIAEPLRALKIDGDHRARVSELVEAVKLDADAVDRYPHEFSGGQRQRIAIARALAPDPQILVADEAVSALDMSVQTTILDLLAELKVGFDLTVVFISHDLSVVAEICDRVAVLERGRVVEMGSASDVFEHPTEEYTRRLVAAVPTLKVDATAT